MITTWPTHDANTSQLSMNRGLRGSEVRRTDSAIDSRHPMMEPVTLRDLGMMLENLFCDSSVAAPSSSSYGMLLSLVSSFRLFIFSLKERTVGVTDAARSPKPIAATTIDAIMKHSVDNKSPCSKSAQKGQIVSCKR